MASEQPLVDPPDEEFDLTKPYWLGYFRLPCEDVTCTTPFEPNYNIVPSPPKDKKPACKLKFGTWVNKKEDGQMEEKSVLVKSIDKLHEREARILSSVSGSDTLARTFNLVRFYGAAVNEKTKEYSLVLECCNMFLQDYVLDKSYTPDSLQWQDVAKDLCKQIASGMRYLHWKAPYNPIVHRNLNPLSVLIILRPDGKATAKLFGFQHAKILGEHETVGKHTVAPVAVEIWQSPEYVQSQAKTRSSPPEDYMKVDVYSYAMLVWHIFTRQLPYGGKKMVLSEVKQLLDEEKRPEVPEDVHVPEFWYELMTRAWQEEIKERPDFIKICKAIDNEDATILDPHLLLKEEEKKEEKRYDWQLDPKDVPQANDRIISNKAKTLSVVHESEEGQVVLKKLIKKNAEVVSPSEMEFKQFMEFSAGLNHPNLLCYDGVFFLETLQMPLMKCSVRQYLEGRTVKRDGEIFKEKCSRGWGNMRPKPVKQVAVGVAKGFSYLHSQQGASHDGLSSSNVLLNFQCPGDIQEVKLVDYQLGLLGTSSQSHVDSNLKYNAPEDTNPKRADLYSLGVLMVYMYKGEPRRRQKRQLQEVDWETRTRDFRTSDVSNVVDLWERVVSKCLDITISLTADEVVSALEAIQLLAEAP